MMTTEEVRNILKMLDGEPADTIESEVLECKPWEEHPAAAERQLRELRETAVAFANARGGTIVLGVADRKRTRREAIHGVGQLDVNELRRRIYDGTDPHILVNIEELIEPEGRLLLIQVPKGIPPHMTSEGVGKIRVGDSNKPLTGAQFAQLVFQEGQRDLSAQTLSGAMQDDLDPEQLTVLRRLIETEGENRELAKLAPGEMLTNLGLVRDNEITIAAILLLGRSTTLSKLLPHHEVSFMRFRTDTRTDIRHDMRGPFFTIIEKLEQLIAAHQRVESIGGEGLFEATVPDLTWWVVREAALNAMVHRDYFQRQGIQIELREDRIVVISPGGFIGGVTPANILRHAPARRNPLLANALQTAGWVNRAGLGVDRLFEELLLSGKGIPKYEADESHVQLTIPTKSHHGFVRFLGNETRHGVSFALDDLILLRTLCAKSHLDRWSAAEALQLPEEEAAARLISLRNRNYLQARGRGRGTTYLFVRELSDKLRGVSATDLELSLDQEAVGLRVQAILSERGRISNADIQRLSGFSRTEVLRIMDGLREKNIADLEGRGRGAHYIPGSALRKKH